MEKKETTTPLKKETKPKTKSKTVKKTSPAKKNINSSKPLRKITTTDEAPTKKLKEVKETFLDDEIDSILEEVGIGEKKNDSEENDNTEIKISDENILTDIHINKDGTIDLNDDKSIASEIIKNSYNVINDAKKVFTHFSDDVFLGKDRTEASKEMLIKALEIQNNANNNLIGLAKVLQSKRTGNGTNIQINTVAPKAAGINMANIKANLL